MAGLDLRTSICLLHSMKAGRAPQHICKLHCPPCMLCVGHPQSLILVINEVLPAQKPVSGTPMQQAC